MRLFIITILLLLILNSIQQNFNRRIILIEYRLNQLEDSMREIVKKVYPNIETEGYLDTKKNSIMQGNLDNPEVSQTLIENLFVVLAKRKNMEGENENNNPNRKL